MTTLLVVDDEKNIRRLYETELTRDGYDVTTAESAEEALEALEKSEPDLVVLDIRLEGMDGIDCLRSIMETRRDLPVILNSAYSTCSCRPLDSGRCRYESQQARSSCHRPVAGRRSRR